MLSLNRVNCVREIKKTCKNSEWSINMICPIFFFYLKMFTGTTIFCTAWSAWFKKILWACTFFHFCPGFIPILLLFSSSGRWQKKLCNEMSCNQAGKTWERTTSKQLLSLFLLTILKKGQKWDGFGEIWHQNGKCYTLQLVHGIDFILKTPV